MISETSTPGGYELHPIRNDDEDHPRRRDVTISRICDICKMAPKYLLLLRPESDPRYVNICFINEFSRDETVPIYLEVWVPLTTIAFG